MADIAQIGFSADTGDLRQAKASLDALVPSAEKVDRANASLSSSFERVNQSAGVAKGGVERLASGLGMQSELVNRAANANFSMAGGFDILTGKSNSTFAAINKNMTAMGLFEKSTHGAGNAIKFTAAEGLNFSRQMSDIGVTLAMGMNPFMVALQQGPQLFDILQTAGMRAGVGIGAAFRAAGTVIWTALAPVLPIILAIAAGVAVVAAGLSLFARSINKGFGDLTEGMGLTEKQMEKVKKAGVDTSVTISDVFFGFFDVVGDRLTKAFDGPLKWLKDAWNTTLDFITTYGGKAIKFIIGSFVGAVFAIKASWKLLPGAIGDVVFLAANAVIAGVEWMLNKAIAGLNLLIDKADAAARTLGFDGIGRIGDVSLGRIDNPFAGGGRAFADAAKGGFREGYNASGEAVDSFMSDWGAAARKRGQGRIRDAAGDPGPAANGGGSPAANGGGSPGHQRHEKTNGEKFDDLMKDADRQIAQMKRQHEEIGLYGEALAQARYEHDLLNQAAEKGIKLGPEELRQIHEKSVELGKLTEQNRHDEYWQNLIEKADMETFMFQREREELNMSGKALIAHRYETEALAEAKRQHIVLTEAETQAIHDSSLAYAENVAALATARDALEFSKATFGDFFKEFYQNVRQGQTLWDAFANAFVSVIDKIVNKLLDAAINDLIDSAFKTTGGGGSLDGLLTAFGSILGGLGFAKGGAFGSSGVIPFAKGGAFTNSVVNSPTLFKFANGGTLGLMGEAGPEAIMPLKRGNDGSLGVQLHGGRGGSPVIQVSVTNHHTLTGAVSSEDVVRLNKQSAEATKRELRQQIPSILDQYQRDGALA